jgi:hypothetical protein
MVLARLPMRYRIVVWLAGLLTFAVVGAAAGVLTPFPPTWPSTAAVGVVLGAVAVSAFLHVLDRSSARSAGTGSSRR